MSPLAATTATVPQLDFVVRRVSVRRFDVAATAPSLARRYATATWRSWELTPLIEAAELLVSELATNACRASAGRSADPAVIAMRLTCTDSDLIIEVWDADRATPILRETDPDAEGGRGLLLVAALANQWAFYRPRTGGKVVWCSLSLPRRVNVVGPVAPLPSRTAPSGTGAEPVEAFDDLAVLQRVADSLRALDWELPAGDDAQP